MSGEDLDRRSFFRHGLRKVLQSVADSVSDQLGSSPPLERGPQPQSWSRLRPPGALAEAAFLEACTRCDACFDACPVDAIVAVPPPAADAGTPQIIARQAACVACDSLACTQVCEPGALQPLRSKHEVAMGQAIVDPNSCVTFHGQACDACITVCPTQPSALALVDGHPSVASDRCIGCGLCEQLCPTEPRGIAVHDPERELDLRAWVATLDASAAPQDAAEVAEASPTPEPERRTSRRVEPIAPEELEEPQATVPRRAAAALLTAAPVFALLAVLGWLGLLLGAPINPAPDFSAAALAGDFLLCLLFVVPHSVLARGIGRRWLNMPLGPCGERPLYVLVSAATLLALSTFWQTSGPVLWNFEGVIGVAVRIVQAAGLVLAAWAALVVGGAHLLGLPHLRALARGRNEPAAELVALPPYSWLRQPLNLGVLIALVCMPQVTVDRLLLGLVFGIWILFAAPYEERDAEMQFGEGYAVYRSRTPRWFPTRRSGDS